jgi:2-hydroxychromene-2-carboxylate isomerase
MTRGAEQPARLSGPLRLLLLGAPGDIQGMDPSTHPPPPPAAATLWFDYIDPASYLVDRMLRESTEVEVVLRPLEVVPPERPVVPPGDPGWLDHLGAMAREAEGMGLVLQPPPVIPWTRKAHELAFHAREQGCFAAIHRAIFDGYFLGGLDIGRVDVLVELAAGAGLDRTTTHVVLDVDRFTVSVEAERGEAAAAGINGIPALIRDGRRLTGFHPWERIQAFLSGGIVS